MPHAVKESKEEEEVAVVAAIRSRGQQQDRRKKRMPTLISSKLAAAAARVKGMKESPNQNLSLSPLLIPKGAAPRIVRREG